jgi:hypothetical protein
MSTENKIDKFKYLWETSSPWALLNINSEELKEAPEYIIVNTETSKVLLISNDDLCRNIIGIMIEKGVKIISDM